IWLTGTKPVGEALPVTGRLTGEEAHTTVKRRIGKSKTARTLSCSASADAPVFYTGSARYVYAGGTISCNETAPLRGWIDLWRRYVSTGTVVIPYDNVFGTTTSTGFSMGTPGGYACSSGSSYKSADVLMQRYNGTSWGGNTVLESLWYGGFNYGCP
ncbi:MAG: hypothetical protein JWN41_1401, partial [Thermoleophilia bacterium]|nr:hypothetical protein [Thermoleophilia bacterium]